jgi:SAM-dependent methyltransferase
MSFLQRFFSANRKLARAITPEHVHEANVFGVYRKVGTICLAHPSVRNVVDCGAGKRWHFPTHYKKWFGIHLIGLDIDANEMVANTVLDERIQCDVTKSIPLLAESVDLILVASGIEHFSDNRSFLKNCFLALKPGGYLLAQFPGRYAPFAIANRLLPGKFASKLLNTAVPDDVGVLGFKAHYDKTNFSAFARLAEISGFDIEYYCPGFYSSGYAKFFFPLWCCSYAYDCIRFAFGWKNLSSYNLFLLKKPGRLLEGGYSRDFELYAWERSNQNTFLSLSQQG